MNRFLFFCFSLILIIHGTLTLTGFHTIQIDWYYQFMDINLLHSDFLNTILYFHSNPPGLSLIYYLCDIITNGNKYIFFEISLPFLHCLSFYFLYRAALKSTKFRYLKIVVFILFFNPLIFIYFRYAFYSTFIFTTSCFLLYVLFSSYSISQKLILISAIFTINCLLRTSWHVFICFAFVLPFLLKADRKKIILAVLILFIPLSIYIKNYILFKKFATSTWMGMNLSHRSFHIKEMPVNSILHLPTFGKVGLYKEFFSENDSLIKKYKNVLSLNQDNYNNVRYIPISDRYLNDYKKYISFRQLGEKVIFGFFVFNNSPAAYKLLFNKSTLKVNLPIWCYDIFDLPDMAFYPRPIGISIYTFVYPALWIYFLFNYRKLSFEIKWLFALCMVFTVLYISIDPAESNRMRFEIEPFYYFLVLYALSNSTNAIKPNLKPKYS